MNKTAAAKQQAVEPAFLAPIPAAAHCGRRRSWIDKKKRNGEIPFYHLGPRNVVFKVSDLDAYMEKHRVDPDQPAPFETPPRRHRKGGRFAKEKRRALKDGSKQVEGTSGRRPSTSRVSTRKRLNGKRVADPGKSPGEPLLSSTAARRTGK